MPFNIGFPELIMILAVALIVFGPRKLPEIGRSIGRAMGEFRRATYDLKSSLEDDIDSEKKSRPTPKEAPAAAIPTGTTLEDFNTEPPAESDPNRVTSAAAPSAKTEET